MQVFSPPQGTFRLSRYPDQANDNLRAWDAADEYILNRLNEDGLPLTGTSILIVNDGFGALSIPLANQRKPEDIPIMVLSDSFLSHQGILKNYFENNTEAAALDISTTLDWLKSSRLSEPVDTVLIKIPKSLAELEEQLYSIRPVLSGTTRVIAGGMTKSIHTSTLKLFESIIGPTKTSLAVKKARLIFTEVDDALPLTENPFPKEFCLNESITGADRPARILSHGGTFSHAGLDMGTGFLLEHMQLPEKPIDILDLGCGTGLVGVVAAMRNKEAKVTFTDESYWAVSSARQSVQATLGPGLEGSGEQYQFKAADCLGDIPDQSQGLVLNNPPFHQRGGKATHISDAMFRGAKRVLREGGSLWVVGNRHLGYHSHLKKIFGNCELIASNPKFVVLRAEKPRP